MYPQQGGAGGKWQTINEIKDSLVIMQQGDLSCGIACGQMLLQDRQINIDPDQIEQITGTPISCQALAMALNNLDSNTSRLWEGGPLKLPEATNTELITVLNTTGSWCAMLWETGGMIGHFVIIDGFDSNNYLMIRDPWDATSYQMTTDDFINYWTTEAIFAR
jgi:ABC-type bacteriocin/lantibiotic exporter with double-glycine peptidase domain